MSEASLRATVTWIARLEGVSLTEMIGSLDVI